MKILAAYDTHALWQIVLGMGGVVLIVVVILLGTAGIVASHTVNIPKLAVTPSVLNLIIEEAIIQDGYMNALTDGYVASGDEL
jgi:hypothetical protein